MIHEALEGMTLGAAALTVWHHAGWPLALRAVSRRTPGQAPPPLSDADLPETAVVMPAHNEAAHIAAKIRNLAALDYPEGRFSVTVACDGCTDGTAAAALAALAEPACSRLRAEVLDMQPNRGKLAVLNEVVIGKSATVIALTDVSAMLPPDALRKAAAHYADPDVGAVGGTYRLGASHVAGEDSYWRYQVAVKRGEAALGAPLGMHGAFWTFRRAAWAPLQPDIINDDFVMPMEMLGRGWSLRYDESVSATEAEASGTGQDASRRRRIAAGNAQQLVRMAWLLDPRHGGPAVAFASGKALRVAMPFLMAAAGAGALFLAPGSALFTAVAAAGLLVLAGAAAGALLGRNAPRPLAALAYMAAGHISSASGVLRYAFRRSAGGWCPAEQAAIRPAAATPDCLPWAVEAAKRTFDVVVALTGLVGSLPFWPFIALAIRLESPGPVIFRQMRIGRAVGDRTRMFIMLKFRSMRSDAETGSGAVWAKKKDARVTRVGNILRKTRIDEIPQLLNVLAGDMSIVGPRPERPVFYRKLENAIPFFADRTVSLRPGITGFAQVCQGYDRDVDDVRSKVAMDHAYALRLRVGVRSWALLDAWVVLRTFTVMVCGRGQ